MALWRGCPGQPGARGTVEAVPTDALPGVTHCHASSWLKQQRAPEQELHRHSAGHTGCGRALQLCDTSQGASMVWVRVPPSSELWVCCDKNSALFSFK